MKPFDTVFDTPMPRCPHCSYNQKRLVGRCDREDCLNEPGCQAIVHEMDWTYSPSERVLFHKPRKCGRGAENGLLCWQHQEALDRYMAACHRCGSYDDPKPPHVCTHCLEPFCTPCLYDHSHRLP